MEDFSPVLKNKKEPVTLTFYEAVAEIMDGKRVTRLSWNDRRHYCLLKDGFLSYHKAGEPGSTIHAWIVNDGDVLGMDWVVLDEENGKN